MAENKMHQKPSAGVSPKPAMDQGTDRTGSGKRLIDFMGISPYTGAVSLILVIASLVIIGIKGFSFGTDFTGGTELHLKFHKQVSVEQIREALSEAGQGAASVQTFGEANEFLIRMSTPENADENIQNKELNAMLESVKSKLTEKLGMEQDELVRVDTVGPQVGHELKKNGLLAGFYSMIAILIYIAIRFDYAYAPGAVLCLVHDVIITLGVFSLFEREVNVQIIASLLTLVGYSINDTIVTFDRIREIAPIYKDKSLPFIIDKGISETIWRSFLTSMMTFLACIGLYYFSGGVISEVAFTLMIGIIIGSYSSIFVASPMIIVMDKIAPGSTDAIPHARVIEPKLA